MEKNIQWNSDMKSALTQAEIVKKPVFLYFMNPPCPSCQQMDRVTYSNAKVIEFINENTVPVHFEAPDSQNVAKEFNLKRTPMWLMLDSDGREHYRTLGFFLPEDLIPSMLLGMAKTLFDQGRFDETLSTLEMLLAEYPENDSIPEAIYLRGGARFKNSRDRRHLKETYEQLKSTYPSNAWTKRAYPYGLIHLEENV